MQSSGKHVIQLQVPRGNEQPYVLEGSKIFLRQEAETSLAMREEIISLIKRASLAQGEPAVPVKQLVKPEKVPVAAAAAEPAKPLQGAAIESPRTGVEIVASEERKGQVYHSMRDLRDGDVVNNVTRASARRLWRYAIALKEKRTFSEANVTWVGDLGLWHKYLRNGKAQYDLVQRTPDGEMHIYYGVTEDGVYGPWRPLIEKEKAASAPTAES
jgi:hypothetical protein